MQMELSIPVYGGGGKTFSVLYFDYFNREDEPIISRFAMLITGNKLIRNRVNLS